MRLWNPNTRIWQPACCSMGFTRSKNLPLCHWIKGWLAGQCAFHHPGPRSREKVRVRGMGPPLCGAAAYLPPWNRCRSLVDWALICLLQVLLTPLLFAGTLTTLDGHSYQGTLRWAASNLVVTPQGGAAVRVPLTMVRQARFLEAPGPEPDSNRLAVRHRATVKRFGALLGHVKVEYFTDREMKQAGLVRFDETIDQFWPNGTSPQGLPSSFSGRWTTRLRLPASGEPNAASALVLKCDGGARIWLDGRLVLDHWDTPDPDHAWNVPVQTGRTYDLRLEYWRNWPQACVILHRWNATQDRVRPLLASSFLPREGPTNQAPVITLVEPDDGTACMAGARLVLEAEVSGVQETVRQVRFKDRDRPLGAVLHPPWQFTVDALTPGLHGFALEVQTDREALFRSHRTWVCAADNAGGAVPLPWGRLHLDGPTSDTQAALEDRRLILSHTGGGLRLGRDSFGCVVRPCEGDFELTARLVSLAARNGPAAPLAGFCLQERFRPSAPRTCLVADPAGPVWHLHRAEEGALPTEEVQTSVLPVWLRLTRRGDAVTSYLSADGTDWRLVKAEPPDWSGPLWVGFIACASNAAATVSAVFDSITFTNLATTAGLGAAGLLLTNGTFLAAEPAALDGLRLVEAEFALPMNRPLFSPPSAQPGERVGERGSAEAAGAQREIPAGGVLAPPARDQPLAFPLSALARIYYKPVSPTDVLLRANRAGLLLWGGDFIEGALVSVSNRVVTVDSLLFGRKDYLAGEEVAAVLLREPTARPGGWHLALRNGSSLVARGLVVEGDRLQVDEPLLGSLSVSQAEVVELEAK